MPITPAASLALPLDLLKTVINRSTNWQTWAGTDYANQVHLNANRRQIEDTAEGVALWINEELKTPFIVIWMPEWSFFPRRCMSNYSLTFFIQDVAKDRHDHDASSNTYATNVGGVLDDLATDFRESGLETLDCKEIIMSGEPTRIGILQGQDPLNDMWTSTFNLMVGPEL